MKQRNSYTYCACDEDNNPSINNANNINIFYCMSKVYTKNRKVMNEGVGWWCPFSPVCKVRLKILRVLHLKNYFVHFLWNYEIRVCAYICMRCTIVYNAICSSPDNKEAYGGDERHVLSQRHRVVKRGNKRDNSFSYTQF